MKIVFTLFSLFLCLLLPAQMPTSFQSRGIGGGGALFSPSINPANTSEIYLACDMSELFHSTNGGASWNMLSYQSIQGGHDSKVQFTNDPNILYCINYYSYNGIDNVWPVKSTDGGATWTHISGDPLAGSYAYHISCDYNNPQHVVLADYGTIWYSSNGGTSFTKIHTCLSNGAGNHIAGVFYDGQNIYIGTNDGIIYSTNGGTSFSTLTTSGITAGQTILAFAGAKASGTTRFFCLTTTSVWAGYQYGSNYNSVIKGLYSMDNANGTWTSKLAGVNTAADFAVFVGMANNDINTVYLCGGSSSSAPIVMKSTNAGGTWAHQFKSAGNVNITTGWSGTGGDHAWSFPEAPFGFTVCPSNSDIVMFSTYSDAYITTNGGTSWKQQYVSQADENPAGANTPTQKKYHGVGLENTTNWQILWLDSMNLFSCFSDINGVMSDDKGASWKFIPNLTQNSVYRMVKHPNGTLYAATSNVHDMYQTTRIYDAQIDAGTGNVYASSNNGASFTLIHNFAHPVVWIALDPTNTDRMYASVLHSTQGGIYVTSNLSAGASSTWTKVTNPTRTQGHPFVIEVLNDGSLVASFSARKPTSGTAFTASSGVFYSTDNGTTWADRSDANMQYYTKDVVIDPSDATQSTWYAAVFSAWGSGPPANSGGLYKTTNKGVSWTKIANSYRVNSCTVNPSNTNELYYTTETDGLWYSSNIKSATPTFQRVTAYPFRSPARLFFNPYKASEIWVSGFGSSMMMGISGGASVNALASKLNICAGDSSLLTATGGSTVYTWTPGNITGNSIMVKPTVTTTYTVVGNNGGSAQVTVTVTPLPVAGFTFSAAQNTVNFTNTSNAGTYSWTFGDGGTSVSTNPSHVYASTGNYTVKLKNTNSCGTDSISKQVTITSVGVETTTLINGIHVFPNPSNGYVQISCTNSANSKYCIFDMKGQLLQAGKINGSIQLNLSTYLSGVYLLSVEEPNGSFQHHRLIIK